MPIFAINDILTVIRVVHSWCAIFKDLSSIFWTFAKYLIINLYLIWCFLVIVEEDGIGYYLTGFYFVIYFISHYLFMLVFFLNNDSLFFSLFTTFGFNVTVFFFFFNTNLNFNGVFKNSHLLYNSNIENILDIYLKFVYKCFKFLSFVVSETLSSILVDIMNTKLLVNNNLISLSELELNVS